MALFKLENLRSRERWGLGLALAFVLVLLVDRMVVGVVAERVRSVEEQAETDAKELAYNQGVLSAKGPIEGEYNRIEAVLRSDVSDSEAIDVMKGEIDDLARASGVELLSMEHRSPMVAEGYTEYTIEIRKLQAPMEGVLKFLYSIWQTPGMMRVQKVTLGPSETAERVVGSVIVSKIVIPLSATSSEQ